MNYFELYQIPISFCPDQAVVKKQYYALCKQYHPDFYIGESEEKQKEVLYLSTLNNEAFKILSDRNACLEYVLRLYGVVNDEEHYKLAPDFLMEMMDLNEELGELKSNHDIANAQRLLDVIIGFENELNEYLDANCSKFDASSEAEIKNILLIIKDNYYKQKYLLRIKSEVSIFVSSNQR